MKNIRGMCFYSMDGDIRITWRGNLPPGITAIGRQGIASPWNAIRLVLVQADCTSEES